MLNFIKKILPINPLIDTSKLNHKEIGDLGEKISVKHLVKHSFTILEQNYRTKLAEIDIIAEKDNKIYFFEVKSVSRETIKSVKHSLSHKNVSRETFKPENRVNYHKIQKIYKLSSYYLNWKNIDKEAIIQVITVKIYKDGESEIEFIDI